MNLKTLILTLIIFSFSYGQGITVGIKIGGIGYHPKTDGNEQYYRYKLNKKGNINWFKSVTFCLAYNFNEWVGIKAVQTILVRDCADKFAGVSHIGINVTDRIVGWKNEQHRGSFSFGPLFYYRKNWNQIAGYTTDTDFIKLAKNKIWERKLVWYGGQIQYDYYFYTSNAFSVNVLPGYPYIYAISAGYTNRIE